MNQPGSVDSSYTTNLGHARIPLQRQSNPKSARALGVFYGERESFLHGRR
jgi:hypothetical protein